MVIFRIKRQGKFTLSLAEGNKCGVAGTHGFDYEFTVTLDSGPLDGRQFVVDHHEVDEAIQRWAGAAKYRGSCEQVVKAIGQIVFSKLDASPDRNLYRRAIVTAEISGSGVASIAMSGNYYTFTGNLDVPDLEVVEELRETSRPKTGRKRV